MGINDRHVYQFDYEQIAEDQRKKHAPKTPRKPKSRSNGEGTVFPITRTRKDGTSVTVFWAAKTVELGQERKKVTAQGQTEKIAIERRDLKILKLKVAYGLEPIESIPVDPKIASLTVGDCLADWLTEKRGEKLSQATIHMYDARIRNHLLPAFGTQPVRLLTYAELKTYFGETLVEKGLGTDSIRQTFICLKSALDYYFRDGIITAHPMVGLKAPKKKARTIVQTKAIRRASKFLGEYLIKEAKAADQEARWFLALMGMRQAEVLGLTDDCLDGTRPKERGRRIIVKQQLQRENAEHGCQLSNATGLWACGERATNCPQRKGETRWVLKSTKTESGYREIPVPEHVWKMLIEHRNKQRKLRKLPTFHPEKSDGLDTLLFTRPNGKPIYAQRDRQALEALVSSIKNLPEDMTVHTLRHVATTALIDGGADRDDLIAMMGWSPKNADAQIATYSSADTALKAAPTASKYVAGFYPES